jgi:Leucine-rich repeat (LRR) protein
MSSPTLPSAPLRLYFWQHPLPEELDNARSAEPITQALLDAIEKGEVLGQRLGEERFLPADRHDYQVDTYKRMGTVTLRLGEVEVDLLADTWGRSEPRWWKLSTIELYLTHPANCWSELVKVWRHCTAALEGLGYQETSLRWGHLAIKTWQMAQSLADDDQIAALGKRWVQAVLNDTKRDDGRPMTHPYRILNVPHMPAEWIEQVLQEPRVIEQCKLLDLQNLQSRFLPAGVRNLKALESLNLSHSKISTLPKWLGELTQLRKIIIRRTPLKRKKKKIEAQLAAILPGCVLE